MFRWLGHRFIPGYREANTSNVGQTELPLKEVAEQERKAVNRPVKELEQTGDQPPHPREGGVAGNPVDEAATPVQKLNRTVQHFMQDAPACDICGAITVRNGACYKCLNCGNSMGCS